MLGDADRVPLATRLQRPDLAQDPRSRSRSSIRRSCRPTRRRSTTRARRTTSTTSRCRTARAGSSPSSRRAGSPVDFIDPANPDAGTITWQGSWRTLEQPWQLAPHWENYAKVWDLIDFPRLLFNTVALAIIGTIGTVLSCTLVAYGFARFRFPGRGLLFTLLLATIFLPVGGHAHPDLHAVREARLGRDVAAACSCRRSSRTPTTCS